MKFKWKKCLVYLDEIIIYSNSIGEHIDHADEILLSLRAAEFRLKITKCRLFTKKIEYVRHIIRPGPLETYSTNTFSLREALPPRKKSELRSFLRLFIVYGRFVKNFSNEATSLNHLLK